MSAPITTGISAASVPQDSTVRDLEVRLENISLTDIEAMKNCLKKKPFTSLSSIFVFHRKLCSLTDEQKKIILYHMHKVLQELLETSLTPAQLLFSYWFSFTVAPGDPHVALFQNLSQLAAKILTDDLSTQSFCPETPPTAWVEALREKLTLAKNLDETLERFADTMPELDVPTKAAPDCPLLHWHNFCHLLTMAFPDILKQKKKAFECFVSLATNPVQSPVVITRVNHALSYLFQPISRTPLSYEAWKKDPRADAFAFEGISEQLIADQKKPCDQTADQTLLLIEALLGEKVSSPAFVDKIQGEYLKQLIRIAEGPSLPVALAAPLIERLVKEKEMPLIDVIDAINETLQHIEVNPCEIHDVVRICERFLAFLAQLQKDNKYEEYENDLQPALMHFIKIKWNCKIVFSSKNPLLKQYALDVTPFKQAREIIAGFVAAEEKYDAEFWPADGKRHATSNYMELIVEAIKQISQLKKPGTQSNLWHQMIFTKNELVIELVKMLYSLKPPVKQKWITKNIPPLINANVSRFNNELIFKKQGNLLLIGRRDNVAFLESPQEKPPRKKSKYPPKFPSPPNGTFVRRLLVKKLPPSPLANVKTADGLQLGYNKDTTA